MMRLPLNKGARGIFSAFQELFIENDFWYSRIWVGFSWCDSPLIRGQGGFLISSIRIFNRTEFFIKSITKTKFFNPLPCFFFLTIRASKNFQEILEAIPRYLRFCFGKNFAQVSFEDMPSIGRSRLVTTLLIFIV